VFGLRGAKLENLHAEVWLTACPPPFVGHALELEREV